MLWDNISNMIWYGYENCLQAEGHFFLSSSLFSHDSFFYLKWWLSHALLGLSSMYSETFSCSVFSLLLSPLCLLWLTSFRVSSWFLSWRLVLLHERVVSVGWSVLLLREHLDSVRFTVFIVLFTHHSMGCNWFFTEGIVVTFTLDSFCTGLKHTLSLGCLELCT